MKEWAGQVQEHSRLYMWGKNQLSVKEFHKNVESVAAGENFFIFTTEKNQVYGVGSNKFGQLGLPDFITYDEPQRLPLENKIKTNGKLGFCVKSVYCGAEHTFMLTDKNEVYSMGLNIKGQLGLGNFDNFNELQLVVNLLPYGRKNPKSLNSALIKVSKPPIVQILEKFDLQVKMEDENMENYFLLDEDEFVVEISCGALFTLALTNKGRVFECGYHGVANGSEDFMEKSKFKLVQLDMKIVQINCGLSGAGVISREGFAYVWGKFGKLVYNVPKKIKRSNNLEEISKIQQERYAQIKIGDEFVALLSVKGEVFTFGKNIDNQLGCESEEIAFKIVPEKVIGIPLIKSIAVGRNHCLVISGNNELYGWGSNRYNQIGTSQNFPMVMKPRNLGIKLPQKSRVVPSSYITLILAPQKIAFASQSSPQKQSQSNKVEQTVKLSEYKKLLYDYQVLKSLNLALLQKNQAPKKENKQVQTSSKFQIDGVTKFRQFQSNIEIQWGELEIIEKINEGGYGVIFKAKWREIVVAVKKFKIQNGDVSLRDFLSECNAMEAVRHPYIVMFLGAVTKAKNYCLVLEYCSRGSLWSYLQNHENEISWKERKRFAIQIAQGVLYLHECKPAILHRDLKSLNIFLDQHLHIKIGDFGWTKTLDEYMTNKIGTYQWMAPEVIGNMPYTEKVDVFSYSIILWEIAAREPPYRDISGAKVSQAVLYSELRPKIPKKTPEPFAMLMKRCWDSNPTLRPSFKQIIKELQIMKL